MKRTMQVLAIALPLVFQGAWAQGKSGERSGAEIYNQQCSKCHAKGVNGAPKFGDRTAWNPRLKQGLDSTVSSAIRGHGKMPSRGGMSDLTDAELRSAVVYMMNGGKGPKK